MSEQPDEGRTIFADPPSADRSMFHGILGELTEVAEPTTEADPVGVFASLVAAVGVLMGPIPHCMIGNNRHPVLVWPLLFGRTGSGRKGEAESTARAFLGATDPEVYRSVKTAGLSSGEGLIERIRDPDPNSDNDRSGTTDKRLLVVEPEFASVMARAKGDRSTLGMVLRDAWDGGSLKVMTRQAYGTTTSHIGIIGHITPKEFKARLAETEMGGGTYNRFLPVYVERSKRLPIPEGIAPAKLAELGRRLQQAITGSRKVGKVGLSSEAEALWTGELYDEFTEADDEDEPWTEFARRAAPYCRRISALHAALDGRSMVTKADMAAAGALVRYSIASAKYILGPKRDPKLDRLIRAVDGAGQQGVSRAQVSALFSRNLKKPQLDALLADLVDDARFERVTVPTNGRSKEVYRKVSTKETN